MCRIGGLVAAAFALSCLSLPADAVPIAFAPGQVTLATSPFSVVGSVTLDFVDLADPDPGVASFELLLQGEFQNYRCCYSEWSEAGHFFQSEEFDQLPYLAVQLDLPGTLSATVEEALGVEAFTPTAWSGPVGSTTFQLDFVRDPQPVPGEPNDLFDLPVYWSARIAYSVAATPAPASAWITVISAGQVDFAELQDGVPIGYADGSGDAAEDSALVAAAVVPEPGTGLLLAAGFAVVLASGRRPRRLRGPVRVASHSARVQYPGLCRK